MKQLFNLFFRLAWPPACRQAGLAGFLVLLAPLHLLAQDLQEYLPKSPEAAALDKFVDIPPGSYTGVTGYSVPLYTIQVDGYSIPITLNYHGMGIKVNEVATSVGLGWSLSAGGISLSQNVIGEQDEFTTRYDTNVFEFDPVYRGSENTDQDYYDAYKLANVGGLFSVPLELQPDYYSYSLINNSGKFIFDSQNNPHTIPKDDVDIISATSIVDHHGIKYDFTTQFNNLSIVLTLGTRPSATKIPSYNLEKITFPSGKVVNFSYVDSPHDYLANYTKTERRLEGWSSLCTNVDMAVSVPRYIMNEEILSKITFDNGEVDFVYDTQNREDIGGKRLNGVIVRNKNGAIIRNYDLANSYIRSPIGPGIPYAPSDPYYDGITKRMILDSLTETVSGKKYRFDYFSPNLLPNRFSRDTDYWGLYNGKNNQTYIPQYTYHDTNSALRVREGADKDPDIDYAKIGSLKEVHLPTGGSQEFEYELNDYKFDAVENQFYKREHTVAVTSTMFNGGYILDVPIHIGGLDYRDGFDYTLEFFWEGNPLNGSNPTDLPTGSYCHVQLLDPKNSNTVLQTMYHNMEIDIGELSQGSSYTLRFHRNTPTLPGSGSLWAKLSWYQNNPVYVANKQTGNLRTKSITLKRADGSIAIKRGYKYRLPSNTNLSSGLFNGFRKWSLSESPADISGNICRYENFSSSYSANTSTMRGKSVVYEYVTEAYTNIDDPSKTFYAQKRFSLPPIETIDYSKIPPKPEMDRSFYGGLLLNEQLLDDQSQKVSETTNRYTFDPYFVSESSDTDQGIPFDGLSLGIGIALKAIRKTNPISMIETYEYNWTDYYYPTTWVKHMETATKTYHDNGNVVEEKTNYGYNRTHIRPIRRTTTTSNGTVNNIWETYNYPQDVPSEPHASQLTAANRINNPLITGTFRLNNGLVKLSEQRTEYEDWGNGILEPKLVQTSKGTDNLEDRLEFQGYDANGNVIEAKRTDGSTVCYIWGYNGTLPVVKVENATYAQVSSYVANIQAKANLDDDRCRDSGSCDEKNLRTALNALRAALPDAMVTTHTYDPLVGVTSITDPKGLPPITNTTVTAACCASWTPTARSSARINTTIIIRTNP